LIFAEKWRIFNGFSSFETKNDEPVLGGVFSATTKEDAGQRKLERMKTFYMSCVELKRSCFELDPDSPSPI